MKFNTLNGLALKNIHNIVRGYLDNASESNEDNLLKIQNLLEIINDSQTHLSEPLRVAVSGFMKAGKSTILNALLKEKILYTGSLVTTYTVSWFKYGEKVQLEIVFKDGTKESADISKLESWTVISKMSENPRIKDVSYVVIYYPNEILKSLEIIDTPGLFSPEDGDSKNTLDFLGLVEDEAKRINNNEISKADAIIYAFGRGFKEDDLKVVKAFSTTSINAIGIFSKTDQSYWDCFTPEKSPNDAVHPVILRLSNDLKDNLYRILPVTALGVEGSLQVNEKIWHTLKELAKLDRDLLIKKLSNATKFATAVIEDVPIAPKEREELLNLFGQYGIYLSICAINAGVELNGLVDYMYRHSGLQEAYEVIIKHFGNRSYLIKANLILSRIEDVVTQMKYRESNQDKRLCSCCDLILEEIDKVRHDHSFNELDLLREFYSGKISFPGKIYECSSENAQPFKYTERDVDFSSSFLHIVGEYGYDCASRLGVDENTPIKEMKKAALEQINLWSKLKGITYPKRVNDAASTVIASLQEMYMHLDALVGIEN